MQFRTGQRKYMLLLLRGNFADELRQPEASVFDQNQKTDVLPIFTIYPDRGNL